MLLVTSILEIYLMFMGSRNERNCSHVDDLIQTHFCLKVLSSPAQTHALQQSGQTVVISVVQVFV